MRFGPRATSVFLVVTALAFAVLLADLAWRAGRGSAVGLPAAGIAVAIIVVILGVLFARGVGEGRL